MGKAQDTLDAIDALAYTEKKLAELERELAEARAVMEWARLCASQGECPRFTLQNYLESGIVPDAAREWEK